MRYWAQYNKVKVQKQKETISFIDAEVSLKGEVLDIGGISDSGKEFHSNNMGEFAKFLHGVRFVCGHNLLEHDVKFLREAIVNAGVGKYIDTLYLSPLLFAKKPYHHLVKDDVLVTGNNEVLIAGRRKNPLNCSKKAKDLFFDLVAKWEKLSENLQIIYYSLLKTTQQFRCFFEYIGYDNSCDKLHTRIKSVFRGKICDSVNISDIINSNPIELAYAVSQIDVMIIDNTSITPPWVLKTFPKVEGILSKLKGADCGECEYCKDNLDVVKGLNRWFNYPAFRTYDGEALQETAAKWAIESKSLLAVFPTGGGKSITFQLPALMQGENEKGLTVVISPLQSLQKDQVDNLETEHNITKAVRLDGSLDPIERTKSIEQVESGGASLLYISPESLRSKSVERLLIKRNVVRFVIDEAHCFSAWGQDFRTDYLYIADFIKSLQDIKGNAKQIPVSCFTATAKVEVIEDIIKYFTDNLNIKLEKVISTSSRKNLAYHAIHANDEADKKDKLRGLLTEHNCPTIIYVSRTYRAGTLAKELTDIGFSALCYHGKMEKKDRIANQEAFVKGNCNIIVATKAFGMGVDKKDVGLVIHYDISTSLEDYVQEAGRAGRNEKLNAVCYALFNDEDINKHFSFLSQTKITAAEIGQIWRAIKKLTLKRDQITASALDIAREAGWDDEKESEISTRVATSINALEQVHFLKRGQNMPKVYANSILAKSMIEASEKIEQSTIFDSDKQKEEARRVLARLFKTRAKGGRDIDDNNERIDYIADREQLDTEKVIRIIQKLKEERILDDTKDLYAFLQRDSGAHAKKALEVHRNIEFFLHSFLLEHEDIIKAENQFNIKAINVALHEKHPEATIAHLNRILNFYDLKRLVKRSKAENKDYVLLKPYLSLSEIEEKSKKRLEIAVFIVSYLYKKLSKNKKGEDDNKIEFSVLELMQEYAHENFMFKKTADADEIEDALYYLKRINSLEIDGGFLVIYNRMSIKRTENDTKVRYTKEHYKKLDDYYESKKEQIHIIAEYLKLLSTDYDRALEFTHDYFSMDYGFFKDKYFKGRLGELRLNMTQKRYSQLFKGLSKTQHDIIKDKKKYIAVIAGPGSGKTMLLIHKLASIYMQEDIKHEQILMLTFSRAAASEFKSRLIKLIGGAANFIKIKTFHSYCFDLLGKVGNLEKSDNIVLEAVKKIEEAGVCNIKLTNAIMVIDEAQDMSEAEYLLIKALMTHNEELRVIAVGDDDQNIYEWRGSSSEFLGRIGEAEGATRYELLENFRSKANIIEFSNNFAKKITKRLKTQELTAVISENGIIKPNKENGSITIGSLTSNHIEVPIVNALMNDKPTGTTCIIVRTNEEVLSIAGLLNELNIKTKTLTSREKQELFNQDFNLLDLHEIRFFMELVEKGTSASIDADTWDEAKVAIRKKFSTSTNLENVQKLIRDFESINTRSKYKVDFRQFVCESRLEDFVTQDNTVLVSTIHQTKGREFDNVYLALSSYSKMADAEFRAIYVAITRAETNLHIQYVGKYLDNVEAFGLKRFVDKTNYDKPKRVAFSLSHKAVFLDSFINAQNIVEGLRAGQELQVNKEGCFFKGKLILKFSKAFVEKIEVQEKAGYSIAKAVVNHIVYWYPKNIAREEQKSKERMIVLVNIEFIRV